MNILVVSDNFTKGGLETRIATFWQSLKKDNKVWFCFANYEDRGLIDDDMVFKGFNFAFHETIAELKEDVDRLVDIIRKKKIDVLHVHPWFGLYAAYFAASMTGVKVVYTYHAVSSLNYNGNMYNELFMQEIITNAVSYVFCVSHQGLKAMQSINYPRVSLLYNPIVMERFQELSPAGSRKWALVSRLDSDKAPSVIRFLEILPELEIEEVDIYGDGDSAHIIKEAVDKINKKVVLYGYCDDVIERLSTGEYDGVIGQDRCAIEGLALGLPVLLIGFGKAIGLIDNRTYKAVSRSNFAPENLREKSSTEINKQIEVLYNDPKKFNQRKKINADFNVDSISRQYINTLKGITAMGTPYTSDLYADIMSIPDSEKVLFHADRRVWDKFKYRVAPRTRNIYVKDMIMLEQQAEADKEQNDYVAASLRSQLEACVSRLEEQSSVVGNLLSRIEELCNENERLNNEVQRLAGEIENEEIQIAQKSEELRQTLNQKIDGEAEKMRQELQIITDKIESMGFRYFINQSIEWRKNRLKEK